MFSPALAGRIYPIPITSVGNLGAIIFGNWQDLVVAQWGGIDVIVNPYTNQTSGTVTISMLMEADVQVRHPESFAIIVDSTL